MTWTELWNEVRKLTSNDTHADNIIGHLMDDYESYDWDAQAPDGAVGILYR